MKILLDTHVFLWWITDDDKLSELAREIMGDGKNTLFLSAASTWEIAIKARIGRLKIPDPPDRFIAEQVYQNAIQALPIQISHSLHVYHLPPHHEDPFDRLLIVQAELENLTLLSADQQMGKYDVKVIWK
ncbi:Death on curing protein, Doc toxin [hydrothermal vent metagenome]|uniref:Death on curing protein, Doc toxin n=1 Tax=hydrothermal vent metagenome TaxID=652676 RepID=A0A3B1CGT1_9ZZZZ